MTRYPQHVFLLALCYKICSPSKAKCIGLFVFPPSSLCLSLLSPGLLLAESPYLSWMIMLAGSYETRWLIPQGRETTLTCLSAFATTSPWKKTHTSPVFSSKGWVFHEILEIIKTFKLMLFNWVPVTIRLPRLSEWLPDSPQTFVSC